MSEPLRIAFVGEGPTDREVIKAAIASMLNGRRFILRQLQPEESLPVFGPRGTGWAGVYKWCRETVARAGGSLRNDVLYRAHDVLILQVDADVAEETYERGSIQDAVADLPCAQPCPPASASTTPLRRVLLRWIGETATRPNTVFCTPSKSIEAWVMAAFFPDDLEMARKGWECHPKPENRLGQQSAGERFAKRQADYEARTEALQNAWPTISARLTEARRFEDEFRTTIQNPPTRG